MRLLVYVDPDAKLSCLRSKVSLINISELLDAPIQLVEIKGTDMTALGEHMRQHDVVSVNLRIGGVLTDRSGRVVVKPDPCDIARFSPTVVLAAPPRVADFLGDVLHGFLDGCAVDPEKLFTLVCSGGQRPGNLEALRRTQGEVNKTNRRPFTVGAGGVFLAAFDGVTVSRLQAQQIGDAGVCEWAVVEREPNR